LSGTLGEDVLVELLAIPPGVDLVRDNVGFLNPPYGVGDTAGCRCLVDDLVVFVLGRRQCAVRKGPVLEAGDDGIGGDTQSLSGSWKK
jgi:hypothetical protein